MGPGLQLGADDDGGQRQPRAERLGQHEHVGHHAVALEGVPVAGAAQTGLGLVEHQQPAALAHALRERCQVAGRQVEHAAGAQHRFDDARGERPHGLRVDQLEGEVELGPPLGLGQRRARAVRHGQREVARRDGPVTAPAGAVGGGRGAGGHAVPGAGEGQHLVAAGDELGHPQRRLVGLGSGGEQQRLVERCGQRGGQPLGQLDDGPAQHAGVEVVELADLAAHGGHDLRVGVAEDRAHLPGGEVEQLVAAGGDQRGACRALHELRAEAAAAGVADQVLLVGAGVRHTR
ncbi:MAG: hypothetical protein PGN11_11685 [Quadrisphaera sp.]